MLCILTGCLLTYQPQVVESKYIYVTSATLKSIDYNVAMTFILNNNNNNMK